MAVSKFRRILPQVIACTVKNLLLLDLGLSDAIPTIIIPSLTGLNDKINPNEMIELSAIQSSWLGCLPLLFKLLGSVVSGYITEPIGRRRSVFFLNLPHLAAWLMLYYSTTLNEVFIALALFGLSTGLIEAALITYVGEICEPSVRGILTAMSGISVTLGLLIVFLLSNLTEWRNVALICFTIPLLLTFAVYFIPESPMWLLSRKRDVEAMESLQWLRGWVPESAVQAEFNALKRYLEYSNACVACEKTRVKCTHPPSTVMEKLKDLNRKRTMKPFCIMICSFFIGEFCGIHHLMTYIVQVLNAYQSPVCPNWATVVLGLTGVCASITVVIIVKFVGKRKIYLAALCVACVCHLTLAFYGFYFLPANLKSFDHKAVATHESNWPLILFVVLRFCSDSMVLIPFMLLCELFPMRSRGISTGISAAIGFVFAFGATKTFYNIEDWLYLPATMMLYGILALLGLIVMYNILPETEKCTLEDIEKHFSDNTKGLTDRKVIRNNSSAPNKTGASTGYNNNRMHSIPNGFINKTYVDERY